MAKQNLSDLFNRSYVTKHKTHNGNDGGWLANAIKSVGYSASDVVSDILPATMGTIKTVSENSKDIIDQMRQSKSQLKRLTKSFEQNAYIGMGKDMFKNALEDLKSGKFYNKERESKSGGGGSFGFNESDFDFEVPDFDDGNLWGDTEYDVQVSTKDGSTSVGLNQTNEKGVNSTVTNVSTKVDDDSAMVGAISAQTKVSTMNASMIVDVMKRQHVMTSQTMNNIYNGMMSGLSTLNDNVTQFTPVITKSLDNHIQLSSKFFNDSIELLTAIKDELIKGNKTSTNDPNEVDRKKDTSYTDASDLFDFETGMINFKDYIEYVKGNIKKSADNADNEIISIAKMLIDNKDVLFTKDMVEHPLKFISDGIVKTLIPKIAKDAASAFDETFRTTSLALLYGMGNYKNSNNAILSTLGQMLGIHNSLSTSIDKSNYKKGPVSWTGKSDKTLNEVIPTYLRKILSAITTSEEMVMDYNSGRWASIEDMQSDFSDTYNRMMLGGGEFSDFFSEWRSFLRNFQFGGDKQEMQAIDYAENFIRNLIRHDGLMGPDINSLRSLTGSLETDPLLQMLSGFLNSQDNNFVMKLFSEKQLAARRNITQYIKRLNNNDTADPNGLQYISTGLTDNPMFIRDAISGNITGSVNNRYITGEGSSSGTGYTATGLSLGIRDQFGRSNVFYTRQILELLLDGIDVRVVETVGRGRGRRKPINHSSDSPHSKISDKLKLDNDRFVAESNYVRSRREDESIPDSEERAERNGTRHIDLQYSEITAEEVQRIIEKRKKDDEESEQLYREMQNEMYGDTSIRHALGLDKGTKIGDTYDKIVGYIKQPAKIAADLFKRADNFLFELVFGQKGNQITSGSLLERGVTSIKNTVVSFGSWMNKAVVTPLSDAFFGDDGFVTKLKDSEFGNDVKGYLTKAKEFVFGTPDENNVNQGGLLSGIANEVKDAGKYVRNLITGKSYVDQYGVEHPENENSLAGKIKDVFNESTGFIKRNIFGVDDSDNGLTDIDEDGKPLRGKNTIVNAINSVWLGIKHRASTFSEDVFGKDTERKKAMDQFKYDMKGNGAKIGAGALLGTIGAGILSGIGGLGLAGSLLLSPLGGAAIGMTAAITAKSSQFQRLMFGDIDENGERTGGLITKGMQDFVKKGLPGIVGGGLIAGTLSTMGALPELGLVGSMLLPGGPVLTGALVGGASLLGFKATNFGKALFGDNDGSKESFADTFKRVFNKDNIKKYVGDTAVGGLLGKLTFNSLVSAGLLPSFFLPGGPIIGALFGLSTSIVSNSDKFRTFMFGKKDEETGEREGGVMGKIKNALTGVGEWVSTTFQVYQENLVHAVKKGIMIPIQTTIDPFVEEIKELTTRIGDKIAGIYETTIGYIKDSVKEYIIKPIAEATKPIRDALKRAGSFIFGMFKKMLTGLITLPAKVGMTAITMPFRLAGRIFGVDANTYTKRRARREFRHETLDAATGIRDRYDAYRRQYAGADQTDDKTVRKGLLKDFVAGRGDSQALRAQNRTRTLFGIKDNATGKMIKEVNDDGTVTGGLKSGLLYKFLFDNAYWKAGTNKETYHIYNKKTGKFEDREYGADYEDPRKQKKELNKEENQRHKDEIARIKNRPGTRKWAKNIHKQAVDAYDHLSDYDKEHLDISKEDFIKQTEKRLKNGENGPWWRADTPEERAKKDEERMRQAQLRNEQMQDTVNNNLPVLTEIGEDIRDTLQSSTDSQSANDTSHGTMDSVDVPDITSSTLPNLNNTLRELNETITRVSHGMMDSIDIPDTQQPGDQATGTTTTTASANRAARRRDRRSRNKNKNNKTTVSASSNQSVPEVDPVIALTDINENTPTHADGTENVEKTQLAILSEGEKVVPNPDDNQREKGRKSEKSLKDKLVQGKDAFVTSINKLSQVATTLNENISQKKNETNFSVKDFASFVAQSLLEDPIGFIRDVVKAPFELVGNMVKRAGEKVYEHILSPVIEVVKEPFVAVKEAISETIDETVNMIISPFKKINEKLSSAVDTVMFGILHPFKTIEAGASALNDVFGDNPLISKLNSFINGSEMGDETDNANGEALSDTLKQDLSDTTEYGENVDTIVKADQITFKDQTEFNDERDAKKALSEKIKSAQEAGSYLTVKAKADEEARQKDISDKLALISQHTSDTAETSAKHSISWDSIFSKKGLITGALLAAIPAIIALINKLFGGDGGGGGNGFLQNLLQNAGATIKWLFNNWGDGDTTVEDINGDGDISNYERSLQDLNYGVYSVGGATGVANNISEGVNNFTDMAEGLLAGEGFSAIDNYIAPDGEWNNASDVKAKVAAKAAVKVGRVGKKAVTKLATKDGTLLNTVLKMCSKGLSALGGAVGKAVSKVGAKVGSTKAGQVVSKILAKVSSKLLKPNVLSKFLGKFGKAVAKLAGDVGTAGLIEIGFVTAGAINGAYSAANLFQVNSDAVDGKMRVISAAIEAVLMTSVGTFIDILDTISMEVLGYSFVSEIAVSAYNALATDDEEAALLAERTEFKDDYEAYIDQEYQNYLQENGLTEEDMSKDEYRASEDATSFSDYNSQVNKTLGGKISDGLKNIGSSIKNGVSSIGEGATKLANNVKSAASSAWDWYNNSDSVAAKTTRIVSSVFCPAEAIRLTMQKKTKSGWYDSQTGSYYVLNENGITFAEYSAAGDLICDAVDWDYVMKMVESGKLVEGEVAVKSQARQAIESFTAQVQKTLSDGWNNLLEWYHGDSAAAEAVRYINPYDVVKRNISKHDESGWYDSQTGSYYVLDSSGSSYTEYSASGETLCEGIDTKYVNQLIRAGQLVEGTVTVKPAFRQKIDNFTEQVKTTVSTGWDNIKTFFSDAKDATVNGAKSFANTVKGLFNKKLSGWYDHDTGSYYVLNDSGNAFDEYSAAGDKIGEGLDYDEIMLKIKSGRLSEGKVVAKGETLVKIGEYVDNVRKNISNGLGNLSVKLNDKMTEAKQFWADLKNGISIQKEAVHNYFNSHTESGWYDAQDGTYYVLSSDGSSYDKYSANGDKIGEGISTETVRDMASSGMLVESEVNINSGISQSALGKCFTNIKDFFTNIGSSVSDLWSNAKEKVLSKLNNLKTTIVSKFASFKFIKNIFVPSKTEAWFDSNGNYYVMNSDGTYTYYNSNGGIITKNVDGETVEEFKRMGLLTLSDIQTKPPAATFISNIKNAAKSAWEAASTAAKSAWEAIKNAFTGGYGDLKNKSSDIKKAIAQENATTITDAITSNGSGPGIKNPKPLHTGGFGGDDAIGSNKSVDSVNTKQIASATASNNFVDKIKDKSVNDTTMSQKDAAVANIQFNNPDDTIKQTIGDSGCGPVVASNLINSLTGNKSISVKEAADYAVDNGYKAKDGGTAPTYFGSIFSKYGIGTKPVYNIPKQLEDGKPIIMLGDTNTPSSRTPFGTVPHYVVAMGMSDDGKVIIQDPLKKSGYQKYKLSELGNIYNSIALDYDSSKSRTKFSKTPVYDIDMSNMPYGKGGTPLTGDECAVQDLRVFNPLTAQDIEDTVGKVHKNCYWTGYGYTFIQASKVAGIDPRFLVSLAINEAGWNPINRHKSIHNYFSINMPDGDVDHGTPLGNNIEEGIVNGALWIAKNYVHNTERNQYTIRKMRLGANESGNHCYNTRQQWEDLVAKIMAYFPRISNYDTSNPFDTGKSSSYTGDSKWAGSYSSTAPDGSTNVISAGTTTEQQTTSGGRSIASALSNFASAATKPVLDYLLGEETTTVDSSSFSSIDTSDTTATDEVPEEETTETTTTASTTTNKNKNTESNAKANMSTTIDAYFKSMIGKASGKYDKVSHPGVDYMGDKFVNSPIAGKKVKEGKDDVRGRFVIIRDSTGHYHRFFNMYAGIQKFPTDISVGTGLGRTGKTIKKEANKGEHLHYEYADAMQGGNTRDPATVKLNNFGGKGDLANSISSNDAPDLLNGFAYYSQNDPRFANESYKLSNDYDDENNDSQTIAVRGCGPTSLAMVASQLTGKNIDPVSLANIATNNNYSTDVGTIPEYFNDVGTGLGLSVHQQASTKNNLINALSSNNPVILQGNSNNSDTPYTNRGHYVVATGMRNGKITINDPRGQMTSGEYDIKDVLNGSGAMWSFDNTGKNLNQIDKLDNPDDVYGNSGIYPDMVNGHIYFNQTDDRWGNKVYAGGSLFRNSGCVVTAIAQTASDVTGKRIEPPEAAATMAGAFNGGSIIWEPAMEKMKAKYGLNYEIYYGPGKGGHKAAEVSEYIKSKLSQNIPVVMHGKYSKRPGNGEHALEAIGLTNDDRVILQDVGEYTRITSKMPDAAWKLSDMAIHNRTNIAMTDSNGGGSKGTNVNGSSVSSDTTATGTSSSGSIDTGTSSRSLSGVLSSFASAATDPIMDYLLGEDTSSTTDTSTTGSSAGVNSADTELSGSTNKAQIWNYFKGRNYSDNLAAGIMGNMERESNYDWSIMEGMKKSTSVPYNSGGYGLIQWTGAKSQRIANNQALKESNEQYGLNSLKGQLSVVSGTLEQRPVYVQSGGLTEGCNGSAFNIYKFKGKYGDDYFNKINNMSVHDATKAFHDCVEISADSNMNLRYKFADGVLSQFGGKTNVGGNGGLGGFGDGTHQSTRNYKKPPIHKISSNSLNKYKKPITKSMKHNYVVGGFGEPVQQINVNTTNDNSDILGMMKSLLVELKSTNTGINKFNEKELSVNNTTNSPIINNTTNNNITQSPNISGSKTKSFIDFDTNKYRIAKQIASGKTH